MGADGSASERARATGERQLSVGTGGRQQRVGRVGARGRARQAGGLGVRAGFGLCTRPIFGPV